jgi:hypothetical protein
MINKMNMYDDIAWMDKENLIIFIMASYAPLINIDCCVKHESSSWNNVKVRAVDYYKGMSFLTFVVFYYYYYITTI